MSRLLRARIASFPRPTRPRWVPSLHGIARFVWIGLLTAPFAVWAGAPGQASDEVAKTRHLLSRATWGVRDGDVESVWAEGGREAWLDRQLQPERIDEGGLAARLTMFPSTTLSMAELYRNFSPRAAEARDARPTMTPEEQQALRRRAAGLLDDIIGAKIQRSVSSERQLEDVMTDFWFNHFNVFIAKGQTRFLIGDYEQSAIRPHVFGRFEDMLLATARHPAMLFYLDNWQSVYTAPGGRSAERRPGRGLNENYARELLELHTLGVDGGYTESDVVNVARAFTGWTFVSPILQAQAAARMDPAGRAAIRRAREQRDAANLEDVSFVFRPNLHDPGEKRVLGQTLPAGAGVEDGLQVIRMLARHPSTARHLAMKLVERFVSDAPPEALVDHIAEVYLSTDGDLRAVTRALFTAEAFYDPAYRGVKVKTPYELIVSALRATGAEVGSSRTLVATLRGMGHLPYNAPAPIGYPAASEDWVNSGAMLARINFGLALGNGQVDGVQVNLARLSEAPPNDLPLEAFLEKILPGVGAAELATVIREDLAAQSAMSPRERAGRALGLGLGSPDFQRR